MGLMGIGLASFVPTLQAYLSNQLPWERRGRGLAMVEYAWALAGIVGLFLMGFVIALAGWRAPFYVLAGGLALAWLAFGGVSSSRTPVESPGEQRSDWRQQVGDFFRLAENGRSARSTMAVAGLIGLAGTTVVIVHGAWLNRTYGLGTTQLGTVALLLGLADLVGSGLASLIVDRLGKRRSVLFGVVAATVAFVALPWFDAGLVPAVAGLALGRICFEFSLVSNLALQSEQVPAERAKMMSQGAMLTLLGFSLGGLAGPWLFERAGVAAFAWFAAAALALAVAVLVVGVKEPQQPSRQAVPKVTPS
jgi:predicted MFS family arabinose efflux permease